MSRYIKGEVKIVNEACLLEALKDLGYTQVEVHAHPTALIGYHGDVRAQRAHVIVRRKFLTGASNDLGFVREEDGRYSCIISEYDTTALKSKHHCKDFTKLVSAKAAEANIVKTATARGMKVIKTPTAHGVTLSVVRIG